MRSLITAAVLAVAAPALAQQAAPTPPAASAPAEGNPEPKADAKPEPKAPSRPAEPAPSPSASPPASKPADAEAAKAARPAPPSRAAAKEPAGPAGPAKEAGAPAEAKPAKRAAVAPAADAGTPTHAEAPRRAEPPAPKPGSPEEQALTVARLFFTRLLASDIRAAIELSAVPFAMEDRKLNTAQELADDWNRQLRSKRTDLLALQGLEILTPAEMEKRYGKPPARLSAFPVHQPGTWLAIANLSGHPAVAILRETGPERSLRVIGYTD